MNVIISIYTDTKEKFSIDSNTVGRDRERKKIKTLHSTFDRKINMIYFVPFAQWKNGSDST